MTIKLNTAQHYTMMEALRRYLKFNDRKESITECWTGLNYYSYVKDVIDAGYMEWVGNNPHERCAGWLRLTINGSKIVNKWIELGYTTLKFFRYNGNDWEYPLNSEGNMPPRIIEIDD